MKRKAIKLSDYLKSSEGNKERDKGERERDVKDPVSEQSGGSNVKPSDKREWNHSESESCKTYGAVKCDQTYDGQLSDTIPEINRPGEVTSDPWMNIKKLNYAGAVKGKYNHL